MIGSTRTLRVWAYPTPADLRKGFDGLQALVTAQLARDPLSGDCYLFLNRTRRRAKVLLWDGTGLCIYQKRLEVGRFAALWATPGAAAVELMRAPGHAEHGFRRMPNTDSDPSRTPIPGRSNTLTR